MRPPLYYPKSAAADAKLVDTVLQKASDEGTLAIFGRDVVIGVADMKNTAIYKEAQRLAAEHGGTVVTVAPHAPTFQEQWKAAEDAGHVVVTKAEATDPQLYRLWKEKAQSIGKELVILTPDEAPDPHSTNVAEYRAQREARMAAERAAADEDFTARGGVVTPTGERLIVKSSGSAA